MTINGKLNHVTKKIGNKRQRRTVLMRRKSTIQRKHLSADREVTETDHPVRVVPISLEPDEEGAIV